MAREKKSQMKRESEHQINGALCNFSFIANVRIFLIITGRSKEMIITKGGESVAPVPIEDSNSITTSLLFSSFLMLKSMRLSNVMVIGDDQHYLTMFVTIKCKVLVQINVFTF